MLRILNFIIMYTESIDYITLDLLKLIQMSSGSAKWSRENKNLPNLQHHRHEKLQS